MKPTHRGGGARDPAGAHPDALQGEPDPRAHLGTGRARGHLRGALREDRLGLPTHPYLPRSRPQGNGEAARRDGLAPPGLFAGHGPSEGALRVAPGAGPGHRLVAGDIATRGEEAKRLWARPSRISIWPIASCIPRSIRRTPRSSPGRGISPTGTRCPSVRGMSRAVR